MIHRINRLAREFKEYIMKRFIGLALICLMSVMIAPLTAHSSWSNLSMSGNVAYKVSGDEVTLWVERIENFNLFFTSGSLTLKIWATEEPYFSSDKGYSLELSSAAKRDMRHLPRSVQEEIAFTHLKDFRLYEIKHNSRTDCAG